MRVTQFTIYNNFITNQQKTLSELTDIQTQLATGKKIENIYDSPSIYTKFLRLDEEINSFEQISSSANFAKTFANQTDTTLNDIVTTLSSFKTKLLDAANDTNNTTSREAIVSELKSQLEHLKDLANTSIDGKYIFSGSAFDKRPISDDYTYQGNDKSVKAFLGAGIQREYNIAGSEIFLGRDSDYKKHMTLNVVQYDKMKANPQFVVRGADGNLYIDKHQQEHKTTAYSQNPPVNETITLDSQIRMLTGVEDKYIGDGKYEDGISYFYVKGKRADGSEINEKFSLLNSKSVKELLDKIGEIYGNSANSKVVDVTLNNAGEIEIKDLKTNKMITDFYMVASDSDENTLSDLVKNGDYVVEFQKSNFKSVRDLSTITANNLNFDNRVFEFKAKFLNNNSNAIPQDDLFDVLGTEAIKEGSDSEVESIKYIRLQGKDTNGDVVDKTYEITSNVTNSTQIKTMQDLMDKIKEDFKNVDVKLEDGRLIVIDNTLTSDTQSSNLEISLMAYADSDNDNVFHTHDDLVKAFRSDDVVNFDKLYMLKDGDYIKGNVSNVGSDYSIVYINGKKTTLPNPNAQHYVSNDSVLADSIGDDFDKKEFEITFKDKDGNFKKAYVTLRDSEENGHLSTFWIDLNNDGIKDESEIFDIYDTNGNKTPAHTHTDIVSTLDERTCEVCNKEITKKGVTFKQLADVVSMLTTNNLPADNSFESYNKALNSAQEEVSGGVDEKGRFYLDTKGLDIELAINEKDGNSLYFQANNAIIIDQPEVDFFKTLQDAIKAVENGNNYANTDLPRNSGIQGALEAIEHVMDRVRRSHAKIGAISNEFDMTISRVEMLKVNVVELQSQNIDTDIAEASMQLNSLNTSYQALLASIAKVNNLTLLNYLR